MGTRLRLIEDGREWTAEVSGGEVSLADVAGAFVVHDEGDGRFRVEGRQPASVGVAALGGDVVWVSIDGRVFEFRVGDDAGRVRSAARDHDALSPPMSGTVVRIAVSPGDHVRQGDTLIVLEAMKMELPIRVPRDAVVTAVHCREGDLVQPGTVLVELGP